MKDLIALVADKQQEKTLETLLKERQPSLGIRQIAFNIYSHPNRDAGVFLQAADFLNPYTSEYRFALVMVDSAWEGAPETASQLQSQILNRLENQGWKSRSEVIVIDPELEVWVWSDSPEVAQVLRIDWESIHSLARQEGFWLEQHQKPKEPRLLLESILKRRRRPRSSALFQELAKKVSLQRCQDPAFLKLKNTLKTWFPKT